MNVTTNPKYAGICIAIWCRSHSNSGSVDSNTRRSHLWIFNGIECNSFYVTVMGLISPLGPLVQAWPISHLLNTTQSFGTEMSSPAVRSRKKRREGDPFCWTGTRTQNSLPRPERDPIIGNWNYGNTLDMYCIGKANRIIILLRVNSDINQKKR